MPEISGETREIVKEIKVNYHAVFAGVIVAMSLQFLLTLLGNAIGLSLIDASTPGAVRAATAGPILWMLGIPLFCVAVGAFIAALIAKAETGGHGVLHGFLVWGLSLLFVAGLLAVSSTAAVRTIGADAFWLAFFSACLSLSGGIFGGYLGSQPLHRSLYRRTFVERRAET